MLWLIDYFVLLCFFIQRCTVLNWQYLSIPKFQGLLILVLGVCVYVCMYVLYHLLNEKDQNYSFSSMALFDLCSHSHMVGKKF